MIRNSFFVSSACFPPASIVPVSNHRDIPSWVRYLLCFFSNLFYRKGSKNILKMLYFYIYIQQQVNKSFLSQETPILLHLTFWSLWENIFKFSGHILLYSWIYIFIAFIFSHPLHTIQIYLQINLSSHLSNHNSYPKI